MTEIEELKAIIPQSYRVATGRGTKRAFAQIIPQVGSSWYATAGDELTALQRALAKMRADRRPR